MSYLQDKKRKNKKNLRVFFVVLSITLFIFFSATIFSFFSASSHFVLTPVVSLGRRIGNNLSNINVFFASKKALIEENNELKNKVLEREARLANHEALFNENEKIKEILLRKPEGRQMVLAGILGNPNQSPYDTLIIDAGSDVGIVVGNHVFAYGDVPVGVVSEVSGRTAKVMLYSTYGQKQSAVLSGSDTFIELIGRGRGNFEVVLPRDFELVNGTLALLPGINPYTIAEVTDVISDPRDPFKKALLKSPINIFELKFVEVQI
ncbi:MAG: rod shape-determining protein MreC [Candidatus Pacebacteria bacterium]|nr:rod shape-determining protein MreC [Candidatus Paceibacterota bacterium]MBP9851411.1 rod shape-determining protein MreC [Candidatus Paceibacterota bacterium]